MRPALLAVLLFMMGCRQIVGIERREVFEGDASGGELLACGLPTRGADCTSCMAEKCCAQAAACVDDALRSADELEPLCLSTEQCSQACAAGDSMCRLGCSKKWDAVSPAQAGLQICRYGSCADRCGPWDCIGHVSWQIPDSIPDMITIHATARCSVCGPTGGTGAAADVHVRVCSTADPLCADELASGDSAADGTVSLRFATQRKPVPVFLEFHKQEFLDDLLMLNTPPLSYDFDVGVVQMDQLGDVDQIAQNLGTTYDPNLALVKLWVNNCNLEPGDRIDLTWQNPGVAKIDPPVNVSIWPVLAVNLPVSDTSLADAGSAASLTRVVARRSEHTALSEEAGTEPVIAVVNLVVRAGAVTLAPFVTPSPISGP